MVKKFSEARKHFIAHCLIFVALTSGCPKGQYTLERYMVKEQRTKICTSTNYNFPTDRNTFEGSIIHKLIMHWYAYKYSSSNGHQFGPLSSVNRQQPLKPHVRCPFQHNHNVYLNRNPNGTSSFLYFNLICVRPSERLKITLRTRLCPAWN